MIKNKQGFTLIELLVVVLIIGILVAVAVPQYQKAVEKSKAAEGMTLTKSVYEAFEHYYLANGVYPTSFAQLDVDVPGTSITTKTDKNQGRDVYQVSEDWAIFIAGNSSTGAAGVKVMRLRGPYTGAGFAIWHYYYKKGIPRREFVCDETKSPPTKVPRYTNERGAYCEKLFQGEFFADKIDSSDTFLLP